MGATDFLVDVGNPAALDVTLQALPGIHALVVGGPDGPFPRDDGHYVVRVFDGELYATMFKMMMESQGYCRIVKQCEGLH